MYADDLLLMSISINHLQRLVDLCLLEFEKLGLSINLEKSACLKIGLRFKNCQQCIKIKGAPLSWKSEIKYLGIYILSGLKFTCNLQNARQKFFRATNGIFSKLGTSASSPLVLLSLINSYCLPVLMFALEALSLKKKAILKLDSSYSQCFSKIFNTWDAKTIALCQFYMSMLPIRFLLILNNFNYLLKIDKRHDQLFFLFSHKIKKDLHDLCQMYDIRPSSGTSQKSYVRDCIWENFHKSVNTS